jgi:hypothetical protein
MSDHPHLHGLQDLSGFCFDFACALTIIPLVKIIMYYMYFLVEFEVMLFNVNIYVHNSFLQLEV